MGGTGSAVGATCPVCGKPAAPPHAPFCGGRCADVDLGRWLTGQYRVPGPLLEDAENAGGAGDA